MKKVLISSILILLVSVSLSAKESFIQVMSISDSSYLNSVKSRINKLGYKTYISKRGKWHRVYAGPFKNNIEASKALSAIKKHVSKDAFLTEIKVAIPQKAVKKQIAPVQKKVVIPPVKVQEKKKVAKKVVPEKIVPTKQKTTVTPVEKTTPKNIVPNKEETTVSSIQKEEVVPKVNVQEKKETTQEVVSQKDIVPVQQSTKSKEEQKEKGFYIGLAAGYSILGVTKDDISGNMTLNFELKDSGINYGAEMGYYFNNNVFISINYQKTDLEDVSFNNAFATLNYQFYEIYSFSPYIGAIAGYNMITWETSPIDSATEDGSASSILGGLQIGSDISLYGGVSLYIFYRYLMMDNITNIETATEKTKIEYNSEQNLNMGIKYNF
jgi:hypothetical protein